MKTYLVEKTCHLLELHSAEEIRNKLRDKKLSAKSRIYDESIDAWVELAQHPAFQRHAYQVMVKPSASLPVQQKEWYFLKGQSPVGSFSYLEMVRMIQAKQMHMSTIVWKQGMTNWLPALQMREFQPHAIKEIIKSGIPGVQNYFAYRKFDRIPFAAKFILHNEVELWRAVSYELGAGGLGLYLNSANLKIGQELFVHKTSGGATPQINAFAAVVSKFTNGMRPGQARYGLEFIDISRDSQTEISTFTQTHLLK